MNKIESGDYIIISDTYGLNPWGDIHMRITLDGERYFLYVKNADEGYDLETVVETYRRKVAVLPHDFTSKLIDILESQGKRKH